MKLPELVLIHGAWHGGWCWNALRERLEKAGLTCHAPTLGSSGPAGQPLAGLYDDALVVRDLIDRIGSPVVLCGHSYGGAVITEAAAGRTNISHLIYLAALMPDLGESALSLLGSSATFIVPTEDQQGLKVRSAPNEVFYNTCDSATADWAAGQLRECFSIKAAQQGVRGAAWRQVPSTYLLCLEDRAIDPKIQHHMARNAGRVVELDCDHSPFLSRLDQTANLIADCVRSSAPASA